MPPQYIVPEGQTFFSAQKKTFNDVTIGPAPDYKISTADFLEAAEAYSNMFLLQDGVAFRQVHGDLKGNIDKLRKEYLKNPIDGEYLQDLISAEQKKGKKHQEANLGLFWLTQNLFFTSGSIKNALENENKTFTDAFTEVYSSTLKPWHGNFAAYTFGIGLKAVPARDKFIPLLGSDEAKVKEHMLEWLVGLDKVADVLSPFVEGVVAPYIGLKKKEVAK